MPRNLLSCPWAPGCRRISPGQVVRLTWNLPVFSSQVNLVLILSTYLWDERLSQLCPAPGSNLEPVAWQLKALTTAPLGFVYIPTIEKFSHSLQPVPCLLTYVTLICNSIKFGLSSNTYHNYFGDSRILTTCSTKHIQKR